MPPRPSAEDAAELPPLPEDSEMMETHEALQTLGLNSYIVLSVALVSMICVVV